MGGGEEEEEQKYIFVWRGASPTRLPQCDTLRDDEPSALLSLACMLREVIYKI